MFSKSSNEGANKWNDQEPDQKRKLCIKTINDSIKYSTTVLEQYSQNFLVSRSRFHKCTEV